MKIIIMIVGIVTALLPVPAKAAAAKVLEADAGASPRDESRLQLRSGLKAGKQSLPSTNRNNGDPQGIEWVPYVPDAASTTIRIRERTNQLVAVVTIRFPDAGYRVASWGQVTNQDGTFVANAQIERGKGGFFAQVITPKSHEYALGQVPCGPSKFLFKAWDETVEAQRFSTCQISHTPPQGDFNGDGLADILFQNQA